MTHQHKEEKLSGLRERNLTKTAPLAFCLYVFLKELHWQGTNKELVALVGNDPEKLTLITLRNKLLKLGYNTSHSNIRNLQRLNKYQLPAIFVNNELTAFVIYEDENNGEILAKNYDGIFKLKSILQSGEIIKIKQESIKPTSSLKDIIIAKLTKVIAKAYAKSFIIAITGLLIPLYIRIIYNIIIPSENIFSCIWVFICGLLILWYENRVRNSREELIGKLLSKIENNLEIRMVSQLTSFNIKNSVKHSPDEVNNISNNIQLIMDYLRTSLIYALLDSPFIIIFLIAIAMIGGSIVWAPIIIMSISAIIAIILSQYYDSASATEARKNIDTFREQYNLIKIDKQIRFLGLKKLYGKRLENIYKSQAIARIKSTKYVNYLQIYLSLFGRISIIISLLVLFNANSSDTLISSQGQVLSLMFLFYRIFGPFQMLLNAILKYKPNIKIYNFLNEKFFLNSSQQMPYNQLEKIDTYSEKYFHGHVEMNNVSTLSQGKLSGKLRSVNLNIRPGELVVISSNDKESSSSLMHVMSCITNSYEGDMMIDGTNRKQFSKDLLSSNIAVAFEKQHFFDKSILYNLKIFNESVEDEEIYNICKFTGIHNYIVNLKDGYHTRMSQYTVSELNKGFRKILTITQALIKDTPILILEEPTNGLSPTEFDQLVQIMNSFRHRQDKAQKRTVVIFSSSEKLMDIADRIYAIDKGKVVFSGNKENLRKLIREGIQ